MFSDTLNLSSHTMADQFSHPYKTIASFIICQFICWEVVPPPQSNSKPGRPPHVGYPRLLIQSVWTCCPCRGQYTSSVTTTCTTYIPRHVYVALWCPRFPSGIFSKWWLPSELLCLAHYKFLGTKLVQKLLTRIYRPSDTRCPTFPFLCIVFLCLIRYVSDAQEIVGQLRNLELSYLIICTSLMRVIVTIELLVINEDNWGDCTPIMLVYWFCCLSLLSVLCFV